jgi:protein-disulfide isomerase
MKRTLPFIIILVVLSAAVGSVLYYTRNTLPANSSLTAADTSRLPVLTGVPGADPPHMLGSAAAPARLEEFADFQCPTCGLFHPILQQMRNEFGDKLQITFREFPLYPIHQHSVVAASAAEAAGMQGKFWEMHDLLYERRNDWKDKFDVRPIFEGYAKQIGLDVDKWKQDSVSEQVAQRITSDGNRGHSMGVKGTPTVFLNDREVAFENLPAEKLRPIIQAVIASGGR